MSELGNPCLHCGLPLQRYEPGRRGVPPVLHPWCARAPARWREQQYRAGLGVFASSLDSPREARVEVSIRNSDAAPPRLEREPGGIRRMRHLLEQLDRVDDRLAIALLLICAGLYFIVLGVLELRIALTREQLHDALRRSHDDNGWGPDDA